VSLSDQDIKSTPLGSLFLVASVAALAISLLLIVNYLLAKALKVPKEKQLIHSYLGSFGNVIYLAYPFISLLFGKEGLLYAIVFSISNDMMLWSFGVYFLNKNSQENIQNKNNLDNAQNKNSQENIQNKNSLDNEKKKNSLDNAQNINRQDNTEKWNVKYLINPNTISFLIGILMLSFGVRFPGILHAPLERLGSTTIPLSMMFIGSLLAKTKLRQAVGCYSIWSVCLIKMIITPLVFIACAALLSLPGAYSLTISVIALQIAMPSQANLSVLADRYQADSVYAAQAIFVSTLLSSVTLPLLYLLCMQVFSVS
jgi:predicted permease